LLRPTFIPAILSASKQTLKKPIIWWLMCAFYGCT
jgi:hypothetical protein